MKTLKNNYKVAVLLLMSAFILSSCNTIIHQDLWPIKLGMSASQVIKLVEYNSGTGVKEYNNRMVHDVKSPNIPTDARYTVVITRKYINAQSKKIVYAFKDDKLIYWGTPLEFASHDKKLINEIGIEAVRIFE